jgi:hypothetical protein
MTIFRRIFGKKINISNLNQRDKEEFDFAKNYDIASPYEQKNRHQYALDFENDIKSILDKNNIPYFSQDELVSQQIKKYGKAMSTPDFLLKEPILINNNIINWIDAKNYFGTNVQLYYNSIAKQSLKYVDWYGSGAFIFKYGHSHNKKYTFNNTMLIDWLEIKDNL